MHTDLWCMSLNSPMKRKNKQNKMKKGRFQSKGLKLIFNLTAFRSSLVPIVLNNCHELPVWQFTGGEGGEKYLSASHTLHHSHQFSKCPSCLQFVSNGDHTSSWDLLSAPGVFCQHVPSFPIAAFPVSLPSQPHPSFCKAEWKQPLSVAWPTCY